jgi:hypothetical protein
MDGAPSDVLTFNSQPSWHNHPRGQMPLRAPSTPSP